MSKKKSPRPGAPLCETCWACYQIFFSPSRSTLLFFCSAFFVVLKLAPIRRVAFGGFRAAMLCHTLSSKIITLLKEIKEMKEKEKTEFRSYMSKGWQYESRCKSRAAKGFTNACRWMKNRRPRVFVFSQYFDDLLAQVISHNDKPGVLCVFFLFLLWFLRKLRSLARKSPAAQRLSMTRDKAPESARDGKSISTLCHCRHSVFTVIFGSQKASATGCNAVGKSQTDRCRRSSFERDIFVITKTKFSRWKQLKRWLSLA